MFRIPSIIALVLSVVFTAGTAHAQLLPFNNASPEHLVQRMLVGQGVAIGTVLFNGQPATAINDQVGSFNGTASNIGLDSGLVICTGRMVMVEGPNMSMASGLAGYTVPPASPRGTPDPDLGNFTAMQNCVAALEFDFIPSGDSISFRFVFGSEEYPEYVCAQFNDAFGFFLSGPGISGPFSGGAINLAVLPGTQVPVAINTVNPGVRGMFSSNDNRCTAADPNWRANAIYYIANTETDPFNPTTTVELDGFTVPLRASAAVQCGQTYHIKMVIAHAGDASLDSAVLIEGGSFSSTPSPISITATAPLGDGILTEGCGEAVITLSRPLSGRDAEVFLTYSGAGITADDLEGIRAQVTIPGNVEQVSFPISAVGDQLAESSEPLTIVATWTSHCGNTETDSITLLLQDYTPLSIAAADVWLRCDRDSVLLEALVSGGLGNVAVAWGDERRPDPFYASGWDDRSYTVTATDQCPAMASAVVRVSSGCTIWSPNVITPNGDGVNDAWVISGLALSGSSVKVFNRWGNEVYSSTNYANNWEAKDLPDGTYYYEVIDGRKGDRITGYLTILANGRP